MDTALPPLRLSPKLIAFWLLLSIGLGAIGPFDTFELLEFPERLAYWTGIVTFSIALEIANQRYFPINGFAQRVLRRFAYVLVVGICAHMLNSYLFEEWFGLAWLLRGIGYVAAIAVFIEAILALLYVPGFEVSVRPPAAAPLAQAKTHPAVARLLDRLPAEKRGVLQHLEARGHFLKVVTDKGEASLRMRLSDALVGLPIGMGVQTHRSHWVALEAAECLVSQSGRHYVRMFSGDLVPISRARSEAVRSIFEACPESAATAGKKW